MYYGNESWMDVWLKVLSVPVLGGVVGLIGILFNIMSCILVAIPFWICWTIFRIGFKYFYFLPKVYHYISLWHCIGVFICLGMIRLAIMGSKADVKTDKQ